MMCDGVPGPPVPDDTLSPFAFVHAISSFRSFAGTSIFVTMICGFAHARPIGSKSAYTS